MTAALVLAFVNVPTASGADYIYFTSINDKLLPITEGEIPVNINSIIYVPYTLLHSSDLGISVFYSRESQTVLVTSRSKDLRFNLDTATTTDGDGTEHLAAAIMYNNIPYLPASFISKYFELYFAVIYNTGVRNIVRISTSSAKYNDEELVNVAYLRMRTYLNDYLLTHPTSASPTPTPLATPRPAPPDNVVLSLEILGASNGNALLDALDNVSVTFVLTSEEIVENADFLRRAVFNGHKIALAGVPEPETPEPPLPTVPATPNAPIAPAIPNLEAIVSGENEAPESVDTSALAVPLVPTAAQLLREVAATVPAFYDGDGVDPIALETAIIRYSEASDNLRVTFRLNSANIVIEKLNELLQLAATYPATPP